MKGFGVCDVVVIHIRRYFIYVTKTTITNTFVHVHYFLNLQVKCMLVLHLISAAFATAALGLMSKHLPYRQDSYHCEHCRRLELHAVVMSLKLVFRKYESCLVQD